MIALVSVTVTSSRCIGTAGPACAARCDSRTAPAGKVAATRALYLRICLRVSSASHTLRSVTQHQSPRVAWQGSLFDGSEDSGQRRSFDALRRDSLDDRSWLDVVPGWVPDHGELFERLLEIAPWQQRTREMWDKEVLEPRLVAFWRTGEALPPEVTE